VSQRQYVGIDLHRRRSVIVRVSQSGEKLATYHLDNDPMLIAAAIKEAGQRPEVVFEATYGYYWLADLLEELGCVLHMAHPSGLNWENRRVKNDERDALELVKKLRLGELPEAWIPPPKVRELRELVRYRVKLVRLRSGLKSQVHAVMAKNGCSPVVMTCSAPEATPSSMPWSFPSPTRRASSRYESSSPTTTTRWQSSSAGSMPG
jgi:transposase